MAKSSKSSSPEFLEQRRQAIAELAKRRRLRERLRATGISLEQRDKLAGRIAFASAPPPQS
jgi:hypothetical protein